MPSFPNNRHFRLRYPESVFSGESGSRKHLVIRIDMHVVLFRPVIEIIQSRGDWIGMIHNIYAVINDVARMRHKLASGHKLVIRTVTEAVAHAAVKSGQTGAGFNG